MKQKIQIIIFILGLCLPSVAQVKEISLYSKHKLDSMHKLMQGNNYYFSLHPELEELQKKLKALEVFTAQRMTADNCGYFCGPIVVPVKELVLSGTRQNATEVLLTWKTLGETNTAQMLLEASRGNTNQFSAVYSTPAAGNSVGQIIYNRVDSNSFSGNTYYRVKQTDIDANFTYSNAIAIAGYPQTAFLQVYPNPAPAQNISYKLQGFTASENARLILYDAAGRTIAQRRAAAISNGVFSISSIATLQPGLYTLIVSNEAGSVQSTFVVY